MNHGGTLIAHKAFDNRLHAVVVLHLIRHIYLLAYFNCNLQFAFFSVLKRTTRRGLQYNVSFLAED